MKFRFIVIALILFGFYAQSQVSKDYTVQAWVEVNKTSPSITIKWQKVITGVTSYNIFRKGKYETTWGIAKASIAGSDTMWVDKDVKLGQVYEYNIIKMNGTSSVGVTYILSGIEVPVVHSRGNVLVVVEKSLATSLSGDLDSYFMDLAADGWKVLSLQVNKTDSVKAVKREIKKLHKQYGGITSLILLGHVPVPYSGNFGKDNYYTVPPDGHPDHGGCWPTDAFYAIDYDQWADELTNTDGSRAENKNYPGDGKFDNIDLPGLVQYYTGRIDLSNLPAFTKNEVDLTKQYIKKAHDFRYKITQTVEKGVIDENFAASYGAFASTGWRNFSVMFGPKNIIEQDFFTTCRKENLLFGYGTGGGYYNSCGGIGTTDSFAKTKGAVFNMLFGSYFGDWDNANNILRAPLASAENGLTNAWSGRPWWQNHPMALGEPIGYGAMLTQNNKGNGQGLYSDNVFGNTVAIELMGDPTLRLHVIAPPTNVIATATSNNTKVNLIWTASTEQGIVGYYIYRSANPLSNNYPINAMPITGTTFIDITPYQGTNYYFIKAVKLTTSASGTYYNLSQGLNASISGIIGASAMINEVKKQLFSVYPNPAENTISLQFSDYPKSSTFQIFNSQGQLVKSVETKFNSHFRSESIFVSDLAPGLYFIKSAIGCIRFIKS